MAIYITHEKLNDGAEFRLDTYPGIVSIHMDPIVEIEARGVKDLLPITISAETNGLVLDRLIVKVTDSGAPLKIRLDPPPQTGPAWAMWLVATSSFGQDRAKLQSAGEWGS